MSLVWAALAALFSLGTVMRMGLSEKARAKEVVRNMVADFEWGEPAADFRSSWPGLLIRVSNYYF